MGVRQLEQSKSVRQLPCTDSQARMPSAAPCGAPCPTPHTLTARAVQLVPVLSYRHHPARSPSHQAPLPYASRDMSQPRATLTPWSRTRQSSGWLKGGGPTLAGTTSTGLSVASTAQWLATKTVRCVPRSARAVAAGTSGSVAHEQVRDSSQPTAHSCSHVREAAAAAQGMEQPHQPGRLPSVRSGSCRRLG